MFAKVLILSLLAAAAFALPEGTGGYENCADAQLKPMSVEVEGCMETPCVFYQGQSYKVTVQAKADRATTKLPYKVTTTLFGLEIVLFEGEACEFLTEGECPTTVDAVFTFEKALEITDKYPELNVDITATVEDDMGNKALCVVFAIQTKVPEAEKLQLN